MYLKSLLRSALFFCLTLLNPLILFSQDYSSEINKLVKIPNSPEAQAFQQYGNTSVSLYTGTPNIEVPIYTFEGREMSLPISLTYSASGIPVEQQASNVGLGWNLNVGGRISRNVNGSPDDCISTSPAYSGIFDASVRNKILTYASSSTSQFDTQQEAIDYLTFLKDISTGKVDAQPDYFSVNGMGLSDKIVFDLSSFVPKTLLNPRIKVTYTTTTNGSFTYVNTWTVTDDSGAQYFFNLAEKTNVEIYEDGAPANSNPEFYGLVKEYYSSWLLTKVISANGKDTYDFIYTDMGTWPQSQPATPVSKNVVNSSDNNAQSNVYPPGAGSNLTANSSYDINQKALTQIMHNGNIIVEFVLAARQDYLVNNAVSQVKIYDESGSNSLQRKINLVYDYFGDTGSSNINDKRLKLDKIEFGNDQDNILNKYQFEYNSPTEVPSRTSLSQDYLGYYNGANNSVLYPTLILGNDTYVGGDRDPNFNKAKIGTLKAIHYPTGGYTQFEYEENKISTNQTSTNYQTFGAVTVSGGIDNATDCGPCCHDIFPQPPKVSSQLMYITEEGDYNLNHTVVTNGETLREAHVAKLSNNQLVSWRDLVDQSLCIPTTGYVWSGKLNTSTQVHLTPGYYQLTVVNNTPGASSTLTIGKNVTNTSVVHVPKAGLRISSIKNYASQGNFASGKKYRYTKTKTGLESSGVVVSTPILSYASTYTLNGELVTNFNRLSYNGRSPESPHIGYEKVFESNINSSGIEEGYTEYNFHTGQSGIQSAPQSPFPGFFNVDSEAGNVKESYVYNNSSTVLQDEKYTYGQSSTFYSNGFYTIENPALQLHFAMVYPLGNGKYGFTYQPAAMTCIQCTTCPGFELVGCDPVPTVPAPCDDPNNYCLFPMGKYGYNLFTTGAQGAVSYTLSVERTEHAQGIQSTVLTENTYSSAVDYLLRERKTTTSDTDEVISEKFYYPKDFMGTIYTQMINANHLTDAVKTESNLIKNGVYTPISTAQTEYVAAGSGYQPQLVKTSKGTGSVEDRAEYAYDGSNIKEFSLSIPGGPKKYTSFIWGYDETLPIAKIENLDYASIPVATISNLKSLSNADIDATSETTLRNALNSLRTSFPDAMITTYTYDQQVGVTSITDPRGYTSYYHYDEFYRLSYVTDEDGKVLNKYNYYTQSTDLLSYPPFRVISISGPTEGAVGVASTFSALAIGGSGNFEYKWYVDNVAQTETSATLNYTFLNSGTSVVQCDVTDTVLGEIKSVSVALTVFGGLSTPTMTSSASLGIVGTNITYTPDAVTGGSGTYNYEWYVNDVKQTSTSGTSFNYTFNSAGAQNVKFKVLDANITGYTADVIETATIYPVIATPSLSGSATNVLTGSSVTFTPSGISGGSGSYNYEWFINGVKQTSTSGTSTAFTLSATGTNAVKFRVNDNNITGHFKETTFNVSVYNSLTTPTLSTSATGVTAGTSVTFTTGSVGGGSGSRSYEWYVNNVKQTSTSGTSYSQTFSTAGTYTVKFKVIDNLISGHTKEVTSTVNVYAPLNTPGLSSNITNAITGSSISFTPSNVGGGSGSLSYEWYIGSTKQSSTSGTGATFTFPSAGTYTVKFRVKDNNVSGYYKESSVNVNIYAPLNTPTLSSNKTYIVEGSSISFTTSGISGGSGSRSYEWYINGVKQTNTTTSFTNTFSTNGTYTIRFKVIDNLIASHFKEVSKIIYVYDSMSPGSISQTTIVQFVNESNTFDINPTLGSGFFSYSWTLQSNFATYTNTSKSFSKVLDYDFIQTITVTCVVTDTRTGETATATSSVVVKTPALDANLVKENYDVNSSYYNYRLTAVPLNGSGNYTYKWKRNGVQFSTASQTLVYLDCNNLTANIEVEITDTRTLKTKTLTASYTFNETCGGPQQ